jgi:hypothetical protein
MPMDWRWWVGLGVALVSGDAIAAPVVIELNAASDLEAEGFERWADLGSSTFVDGTMVVDTVGYEEWILDNPTQSKWWDNVHPSKGWWVEARLRVDEADPECPDGPGIWISDRVNLWRLNFGTNRISAYPTGQASVDMTQFRVVRFEADGPEGPRRVLVDGVVMIDVPDEPRAGGTQALNFGDLGGCGHSLVTWDYFSYDTFAPGRETDDDDGDGVTNDVDNCFEVVNSDQANRDGDGLGDVCDPCPVDVLDDSDGDGLCDSDDACPSDPAATEEPCPDDGESGFVGDGFLDGGLDGGVSVGPDQDDDGCGCRSAPRGSAWLVFLAIAALGIRSRSRT